LYAIATKGVKAELAPPTLPVLN